MPELKVITNSACETSYDLDGERIRLWIVTGGTPAVSFGDGSFSQRFPKVERWSNQHWLGHCYDHQNLNKLFGPTIEEVLPNGVQTLLDWHKKNKPLHELRMIRWEQLRPYQSLRSRRFHDKLLRCYFWLTIQLASHYISVVKLDSSYVRKSTVSNFSQFNLPQDQRLLAYMPDSEVWLKAYKLLSGRTFSGGWEILTKEQFGNVMETLAKVKAVCS